MNSQNTVNRIEYIDTAKAIAILSVIVGHCYWIKSIPYGIDVIYSFHMSLFFIVSGYFSKPLLLKDAITKFLKAYIKPLAFTVVIALILVIIGDLIRGESIIETTKEWCKLLFYMYGDQEPINIPRITPLWFLYALFASSVIFSYLLHKFDSHNLLIAVFGLLFLGLFIRHFRLLPLTVCESMVAVAFLMVGRFINECKILTENKITKLNWIIICFVWICSIPLGTFFFKTLTFGKTFITVLGSIAATLAVFQICKLSKIKLKWIGRNTFSILCGHVLSFNILKMFGLNYEQLTMRPIVNLVIEIGCQITLALLIAFVLTRTPIYKKK